MPQQKVTGTVICNTAECQAVEDESTQSKDGAGALRGEGLCHSFVQGRLCRPENQTCRGVNPRRGKLWEKNSGFLFKTWNSGTSWKLLGEFGEMCLVLSQSCWESCGSTPAGGCTWSALSSQTSPEKGNLLSILLIFFS